MKKFFCLFAPKYNFLHYRYYGTCPRSFICLQDKRSSSDWKKGSSTSSIHDQRIERNAKTTELQNVLERQRFLGCARNGSHFAKAKTRITELMLKSLNETRPISSKDKLFKPVFFKSPLEIVGSNGCAQGVTLGINKLKDDKAILTARRENLECNLVVTSIGYKSVQADPDILFDDAQGVVKNDSGKVEENLYSTGWLATGPTGVIVTTMNNAFMTADTICQDLRKKNIEEKPGYDVIKETLHKKNIQIVTWKDWLKIDAYEQKEGKK